MEVYRMMQKCHADHWMKGQFRLGRLRYYQLCELILGDESIGDIEESRGTTSIKGTWGGEDIRGEVGRRLEESGVLKVTGELGNVTVIADSRYINEVDCFVFCLSTSKSPDLSGAGSEYDTRVDISDIGRFVDLVWNKGVDGNGRAVSSIFSRCEADEVTYEANHADIRDSHPVAGDAFRKRERYSGQHEFRVAFMPAQTICKDFVYVSCPEAASLLTPHALDQASVEAPKQEDTSDQTTQYREELRNIVAEYARMKRRLSDREVGPRFEKFLTPEQFRKRSADLMNAVVQREKDASEEFNAKYLHRVRVCLFKLRPQFPASTNDKLDRILVMKKDCGALFHFFAPEAFGS